jgi:hypothetical protein
MGCKGQNYIDTYVVVKALRAKRTPDEGAEGRGHEPRGSMGCREAIGHPLKGPALLSA